MPKNKEDNKEIEVQAPEEAAQPSFTKEQILFSARYKHRRFFLAGVLEFNKKYTIAQIEKILERKDA